MGLFDIFKKLLKKKIKNTPEEVKDTTIVPYDTSLVILPKYKELSKQEQEEVESYKQEINIDNMKTLILYSTEMTNYANINVNLLLKAYFSLIEKPADWQLEKMNVEEVQRARIDAMIQEEELQIYLAGLSNLKQESVLRAVAIEEIIKQESKRKIDFLGLFGRSERMRKRNQLEQLSAAEERMKITVKTMEQLMQAVNNTMKTHENTVFVSEVYNTVLNTRKEMISRMESEKREILQKKLNKTLDLATLVIPNEIEQFKMITNDLDNLNLEKEREIIKKIAFMQRKITIYANTHQSEIPLLNEEVQKLKSMQITINNQNQLLQNIERIQKMYEVFGGFVKVEELEALYEVKFKILASTIYIAEENPFKEIESEKEEEAYIRILEKKIETIIKGQNQEFAKTFKGNLSKAVEAFIKALELEKNGFSAREVLKGKLLLSFVLAFDKENGMEEFCRGDFFERKNLYYKYDLNNDYFVWKPYLSLETIYILDKMVERDEVNRKGEVEKRNYSIWHQIYKLYSRYNANNNLIYSYIFEGKFKIPEGIVEILPASEKLETRVQRINNYGVDVYAQAINKRMQACEELIFPSSLRKIRHAAFKINKEESAYEFRDMMRAFRNDYYRDKYFNNKNIFRNCKNLEKVQFQEGLEEIEDYAFCGLPRLMGVEFPKSLKKIGAKAFAGCKNMREVVLNEGLEEIGESAFCENRNLERFSVPAHDIDCNNLFTNFGGEIFSVFQNLEKLNRTSLDDPKVILEVRGYAISMNILDQFETFNPYYVYCSKRLQEIRWVENKQVVKTCEILKYERLDSVKRRLKKMGIKIVKEYQRKEF